MASTVDQSLLSQLKQKSRDCDIVTAAFENGVPSRYNVFIINVGANFYFKNSDTQTVGPYSVRVGSGGDYPVLSACRDCCVQIFGAMNVLHEPTGQVKDIKEFRKPSEPGQCLLVERFRLVIQRDATEDELSAARKSSDWSGPLLALEAFWLGQENICCPCGNPMQTAARGPGPNRQAFDDRFPEIEPNGQFGLGRIRVRHRRRFGAEGIKIAPWSGRYSIRTQGLRRE